MATMPRPTESKALKSDSISMSPAGDPEKAADTSTNTDVASVKSHNKDELPYCAFSERTKILTMLGASFAGLISPMSASIYYPALPALAEDMHVSNSLINLTVMTYLVRSFGPHIQR